MKPTTAEYIFVYASCALMMAGVFHHPLGLPEYSDIILILGSLVCLICYLGLHRRRKLQAEDQPIARPNALQRAWANKSTRLWIIIAIFAVVSCTFPFIAPYTVANLSFPQAIVSSVITFGVGVALAVFISHRSDHDI